jgi:hypothetical protein
MYDLACSIGVRSSQVDHVSSSGHHAIVMCFEQVSANRIDTERSRWMACRDPQLPVQPM